MRLIASDSQQRFYSLSDAQTCKDLAEFTRDITLQETRKGDQRTCKKCWVKSR